MKRRPANARQTTGRLPQIISVSAALCLLVACNDPIVFTSQTAAISNPATGSTWYGPYPMDLGDVRDWTDATAGTNHFYQATNVGGLNIAGTDFVADTNLPVATYSKQSFGSFQVQSNGSFGALVTSLWDGTFFRPFGRTYRPYSSGGNGWSGYGPQGSFLDATSQENSPYLSMGLNASGVGLALFSDGISIANTGNTALNSAGTWAGLSTASQIATTLTAAAVLPGKGYVAPDSTSGTTIQGFAANGSPSSVAWDSGAHAYYSYVDSSSTHKVSYLSTYNAFTAWNAAGPQRLGPLTSQTQLVGDGYGMTDLWVGQDFLLVTPSYFSPYSIASSGLALGADHACGLVDQSLYCWGNNSDGQTGIGDLAAHQPSFPHLVNGIGGPVLGAAAGTNHTCAVTRAGSVACWGTNDFGQAGSGTESSDIIVPTPILPIPTTSIPAFVQVTAGNGFSCALSAPAALGLVYCWGNDTDGELGDSGYLAGASLLAANNGYGYPWIAGWNGSTTPVTITLPSSVQIASGNHHTCALTAAGAVYCWGKNNAGQLGDGTVTTRTAPVTVGGLPVMAQIAAGGDTTCGVSSGGAVYCWGDNTHGQVFGNNYGASQNTPALLANGKIQISVGTAHVCALSSSASGTVSCWGQNLAGEIGSSSAPIGFDYQAAQTVSFPSGVVATSIAVGGFFSCATTAQGPTYCWGQNTFHKTNGIDALGAQELVPLELAGSANQTIHAGWTVSSSQPIATISTGDVKSMASATDGQGNVLAVFLQSQPTFVPAPTGTVTSAYPIRHNDVRVYAAVRGITGTWTGPTQIDDGAQFPIATTTTYQEAWGRATNLPGNVTGGIEYFSPGVAYLGGGKFLAAFAMTDLSQGTSSIYVRGYTVGTGWDPSTQTFQLDSMKLSSNAFEAYRYANDLSLSGDGQGDALLTAQVVVPSSDGSNVTLRNYGMKAFVYSGSQGGWISKFLIPNSLCRANSSAPSTVPPRANYCWDLKPQGMVFSGGEAVVTFPAPTNSTIGLKTGTSLSTSLRLFTTVFKP